ncbi:MAG: polysaccharide biosynthesis tyrosine autokinase [Coriobacteriia bacterium]|nr:polysaccharide biosynthesis tyrosine autokinase [Coriobacteriia bacterium]
MDLRDYLNVLRARKWIVIQAIVISTLVAVVLSMLQPPTYEGSAKVLISEKDTGAALLGTLLSDSSNFERSLQTQVQLMRMRPLAESAIRKLNLKTDPGSLLSRVKVSVVGQTNIITIVVTDTDPKRAAETANALADAYVDWSRSTKRESIKAAGDEIQSRLDEARAEILVLGAKIKNLKKDENGQPIRNDQFTAELSIATGLYTALASQLEQLRVNEQLESGSGRVVAEAVVDDRQVAPKPLRNGALGLVVGLILGLGMAFLVEYLDNTIKSTEEAERLYGAPVLGHIPAEHFEKGEKRRLTIVTHPGSVSAESYRVLRNSLDFVNFQHDIKTLLVTSAAPGEGKSTVAANLAAGLAQTGKKVVLVSCDFRRPTTEQFFGIKNMMGLSDVLMGRNSLKASLQRPREDGLLVLTSGKMPPNPSELLGSEKMRELVESLKEWGDWVIIDSPPLLAVADPAAVARWADGVLMVTRGGTSTREAAKKAREQLEKVGARMIGVVVWGLQEPGSGGGYGYYYDSYYGTYRYGGYYTEQGDRRSTKTLTNMPDLQAGDSVSSEPEKSVGRRIAEFTARFLAGLLAFMLVMVIAVSALYFLDQYFGWGASEAVLQLVGLR